MKRARTRIVLLPALVALTALGACGSVPLEHFYMLTADTQSPSKTSGELKTSAAGMRILVGPVTVAEIVDRPQMVVQLAPNRVVILEQQRWAESLDHEIPRVVALNLARQLSDAKVSAYPMNSALDAAFRVALDVQRFESIVDAEVNIDVVWTVRAKGGGDPMSGRSVVKEPVASPGFGAIAAAHSRALAVVSRDIADAISRFPASQK